MADLSAYLRREAARPFALGSADCCTLAGDWVRLCRGADPMAAHRGYSGEREALAEVSCWGGLLRAVARGMRSIGCAPTREPKPGDIAIVRVGVIAGCAIRSPHGWIMRLNDGMTRVQDHRARVIAAWRV